MNQVNSSQLLKVNEVAGTLGISYFTALRYIHEGKIKAIRMPAGWRIPVSALDEYCTRYGMDEV